MSDPENATPTTDKPSSVPKGVVAKKTKGKKPAAKKIQAPRKTRSDKGSKVPAKGPRQKPLEGPTTAAAPSFTQGKKFTHIEASAFNTIQENIRALSEAIHQIPQVASPYPPNTGLHARLERALTEQLNALANLTQEFFSTSEEPAPAAPMVPVAPEPLKPLDLGTDGTTGGTAPAPAIPIYTDAKGTPTPSPSLELPPPLAPTPIIG